MSKEQRAIVLAYHFPSSHYGRGVCGTHGMMETEPSLVTCKRCKRNAAFEAALNIGRRYGGQAR